MQNTFVHEKYETFEEVARKIFQEDFFDTLINPTQGRASLRDTYRVFCSEQFTQIHPTTLPESNNSSEYIPEFARTFTITHNYDTTHFLQWQAPGGSGKTQQTLIFAILLFFSKYELRTVFSVSENSIVEEIEQRLQQDLLPHLKPEYQDKILVVSLKGWEKLYRDAFHGSPCQQAEHLDLAVDSSGEIYRLKFEQCPTCLYALKGNCPLISRIIQATQSHLLIINHHVLLKTKQIFTERGEKRIKSASTSKTLLTDRMLIIDESERFTELCFEEGYLDLSRSTISSLESESSHPDGTNRWLKGNEKAWKEKLKERSIKEIGKEDPDLANTLTMLKDGKGRGNLYNRTYKFLRDLKTFIRRMDDFADACNIDERPWQVRVFDDLENAQEIKEKLVDLFVEAYFLNQTPFMKYRLILYKFDESIKKAVELIHDMGSYTNHILRDFLWTMEKFHQDELATDDAEKFEELEAFFTSQETLTLDKWREYLKKGRHQIKQMFRNYGYVREFWLTKIRFASRYNPNSNVQANHYDAGLFFPTRMYGAFRRVFLKSPYICLMSATGLSNTPQNEYMNTTFNKVLKYFVENPKNQQMIYTCEYNDTHSTGKIHVVKVEDCLDPDNSLKHPNFLFHKRHGEDRAKESLQAKMREILLLEQILSVPQILPNYEVQKNIQGEIDFHGSCGVFIGSNREMTWIKEMFEHPTLKNAVVTRSEIAREILSNPEANIFEQYQYKLIFMADSQDKTFEMAIGYTDTQKISDYALHFHGLFCRNAQNSRCMYIGLWQGNYRGVNLILQDRQQSALKRQHWLFYSKIPELSLSLLHDRYRASKRIPPEPHVQLQQIFAEFTFVDFLREKDQLICRSHRYPNEDSFLFLHDCREFEYMHNPPKANWAIYDFIQQHKATFSERFCKHYIEPLLENSIETSCQLILQRKKDVTFENDFVIRCQQIIQSEANLTVFHDMVHGQHKPNLQMLREIFLDFIEYGRKFSNEEFGFIVSHNHSKAVECKPEFKEHLKHFLQKWEGKLSVEELKCCKNRIFREESRPLFQGETTWKKHFE